MGGEKRHFRISVYFVIDKNLSIKEYTPADFPEINCTEIFELMPLTFETVRQQIEAERKGYPNAFKGPLIDFSTYQRGLELIVYESKESLYRAVDLLANRDDIAAVYYDEWVKPGFQPIRGKFADLGLDVETENQVLLDWFYLRYPDEDSIERLTWSADSFNIDYYFGAYHGYVVVGFDPHTWITKSVTVADKNFGSGANIFAWKKSKKPGGGRFYEVQEAYALGLLTTDDVENMYDMYLKLMRKNVEERFSDATLEVDFADDSVVVVLNYPASSGLKTYTPEDFPEIDCIQVIDATDRAMEIFNKQLEAEKTGFRMEFEKRMRMGVLMDAGKCRKILGLKLADTVASKEYVLNAVKLLEKRKDVLYAERDYIEYLLTKK
jgi:hypothetical protein